MRTALHLTSVGALAAVLITSGVLKLRDRSGTREAVTGFSIIPAALVVPIAMFLPVVEVGLGLALLVVWGRLFAVAALLSLALMTAFAVVVGVSLARGERPTCHCFGEASSEPISTGTVVRNVALVAVALVAVALGRPFDGFFPVLGEVSAEIVSLVVLSVSAGALIWWLWFRLADSHRARVRAERERDEARERPTTNAPVSIPDVVVHDRNGAGMTLAGIVAGEGKARLLVGVSPGCAMCKDLVPQLPVWREQFGKELGVTVLSWGTWEASVEAYGDEADHLFVSPDGSAFMALGMSGTPAVVLLGNNNTVAAGPAMGQAEILELLTTVVQAIGVNMMTGQAHQVQEPQPLGGGDSGEEHLPRVGSTVAEVRVQDERGVESTLVEALARIAPQGTVPVVAWRDTCPYCGEIATEIAQFSERAEVVLLANEPIASVRAQGILGPVLQTVGADASAVLGVPGTPAGYPVDCGAGEVRPGGGAGGGSVLRMLIERARDAGTYVETPALRRMELMLAQQHTDHGDRDLLPLHAAPSRDRDGAPAEDGERVVRHGHHRHYPDRSPDDLERENALFGDDP